MEIISEINSFIVIAAVALAFYSITDLLMEQQSGTSAVRYAVMVMVLLFLSLLPSLISPHLSRSGHSVLKALPMRQWRFLLGPFLLYYQRACLGLNFKKNWFVHTIPFILWHTVFLLNEGRLIPGSFLFYFHGASMLISLGSYCIYIFLNLEKHSQRVGDSLSYKGNYVELKWLKLIVSALFILTVIPGIGIPLMKYLGVNSVPAAAGQGGDPSEPVIVTLFHNITTLGFIIFFSLFASRQNGAVLTADISISTGNRTNPEGKEQTKEPEISPEIIKAFESLTEFMIRSKIYLDNNLNLQILSTESGIARNELSRMINSVTGENFFHFVNGFRAREFRMAVTENRYPSYSLLGIGMECGFNSKSTFNAAVKKEFGVTPSRILKENPGKAL